MCDTAAQVEQGDNYFENGDVDYFANTEKDALIHGDKTVYCLCGGAHEAKLENCGEYFCYDMSMKTYENRNRMFYHCVRKPKKLNCKFWLVFSLLLL